MDFVVVRVNGKNLNAKSLEETLEGMPHSNESIVVELRRRDAQAAPKHPKPPLHPLSHGFRENSRGNFQTLSSSDDQAASSTMTSDYICIDKGHDPDEDNDDDDDEDDDGDDEYDDLELWCGSKELSSNFITHMTNCKVCSDASDLHLSLLESLQQLEESESEDEDSNNNNKEYDEVADDIKSFESDSALDDSMVRDADDYRFYSPKTTSRNPLRNNSTDTTISSTQEDSAIGRTDDSIRADESSEQELVDNYGAYPHSLSKSYHFESAKEQSSSDLSSGNNSINNFSSTFVNELADKFASTDLSSNLPSIRVLRRSRKVPRMGTKITKHTPNEVPPQDFEDGQVWLRQSNLNLAPSNVKQCNPAREKAASEKFKSNSSSKSSLSDHSKESVESTVDKSYDKEESSPFHPNPSLYTTLKSQNSRTSHLPKRCLRSGTGSKGVGKNVSFDISEDRILQTSDDIDEDNYMHLTNVVNGNPAEPLERNLGGNRRFPEGIKTSKDEVIAGKERGNGELLKKLYSEHIDVMYTNQANLEHTMMVQQKLFTQQLHLLHKNRKDVSQGKCKNSPIPVREAPRNPEGVESTDRNSEMQWVMKRRSDGSRYITRRPAKKERTRKRADKFSKERKDFTTDDDAASEMKAGKYWTREERREQVREKKNRIKMKMEAVCENDDTTKKHRQHQRDLNKKEKPSHQARSKEGHRIEVPLPFIRGHLQSLLVKNGNRLLSVTTV